MVSGKNEFVLGMEASVPLFGKRSSQRHDLETLHKPLKTRQIHPILDTPLAAPPSSVFMRATYRHLSLTLFDLNISPHCPFGWFNDIQPGAAVGRTAATINGSYVLQLNQHKCTTWRKILVTLLHEICHAYIRVYICDTSCGNVNTSFCFHWMSIGQSGHGWAWQQLALWVETFARDWLCVPRDFDLMRMVGVVTETIKIQTQMPWFLFPWFFMSKFFTHAQIQAYYAGVPSRRHGVQYNTAGWIAAIIADERAR